jgi:hypothetical protein
MRSARPLCYHCWTVPVRKGSRFCTQRCGALWADEIAKSNDDRWCPACKAWTGVEGSWCDQCGHEHKDGGS